jgi:hypothetical protein
MMSTQRKEKRKGPGDAYAQTATELAVFGAILIFLFGVIIRQSLSANFNQDQTLKALRVALQESFKSGERGDPSRNVANILYIEDRKTADFNKFGTLTRLPLVVSGSGSFTKNLFMPVDFGNQNELPIMDMFINGKHFTFTTAGFRTVGLTDEYVYRIVPNIPSNDEYDSACDECFDLDRNGSVDVPAPLRSKFSWQWKKIRATSKNIDVETGENTSVDVDGDLKEELVLGLNIGGGGSGGSGDHEGPPGPSQGGPHPGPEDPDDPDEPAVGFVRVLDPQGGDIDLTYDSRDKRQGLPRPGLTENTVIYSFTKDGTFLAIDGNTSTQNIANYDVIERQVQLSNNTGRICSQPSVEACGDCQGANVYKTCYDSGKKILYVRSRIKDLRGRVWATSPSGGN